MQHDNILRITKVIETDCIGNLFEFTCYVEFNDKRGNLRVKAEIEKHDICDCYIIFVLSCIFSINMTISDKLMREIVLYIYLTAKKKQLI
jgi:hypothetical protein